MRVAGHPAPYPVGPVLDVVVRRRLSPTVVPPKPYFGDPWLLAPFWHGSTFEDRKAL